MRRSILAITAMVFLIHCLRYIADERAVDDGLGWFEAVGFVELG